MTDSKDLLSETASIFVCGDILNKENSDGLICSKELSKLISSADYAVCNFEGPIDGLGKPAHKSGIHISQKAATIDGLQKQGFNLLLLATNHILDYGEDALVATIKKAVKCGLDVVGAGINANIAYHPFIKMINGLKIGIVNGCEAQHGEISSIELKDRAGHAWINHPIIDRNIINLRKRCDYVIVFSHAGLEHYPIPQKEWRERYKHFCYLGADVVIGSHPHVPQGYEKQGKSLIFYSLGNFYFDLKNVKNKENKSFSIWFDLSKDGIKFNLIQHYVDNGKVKFTPAKNKLNIDKLNAMLEDNYWVEHEKMTLDVYNKIKRNLALSVFMPVPLNGSFNSFFRMYASWVFNWGKVNYKDLYQLHLLKNESYYYAIKHALELNTQKIYG